MNRIIILSILLLFKIICFSQVETLMRKLNGKDIGFKNKYESVVADYKTDTTTILANNNQIVDLALFNSGYNKQNFVKTKVDLYVNNNDTVAYTYGFFKDRLFQIKIYSNSDSINRVLAKKLQDYFNVTILAVTNGKDIGHFSSKKVIKNTHFSSYYQYNKIDKNNRLNVTLTYEPIMDYLPLWCGTGRKEDWETRLEKKLTSN